MPQRVRANINAHVLVWARQTAGYVLEEAARKIGISPEKLQAWEAGEDKPTLRQLRIAANVYKRPTALFYCSTPPPEPPDIADFRVMPAAGLKYTPRLLYEIRIVLRSGGVCDLQETESESIETYCNRVAGEVLVPRDALLCEETVVENGGNTVWEDWRLKLLADRYMVSQEVILRRLLAVLSAYHNEAISSRDLSNSLGGIKLEHVGRIEHALFGGEGSVEV